MKRGRGEILRGRLEGLGPVTEDALAAPLVTLAGDNSSTQVNSTDLWCNNK